MAKQRYEAPLENGEKNGSMQATFPRGHLPVSTHTNSNSTGKAPAGALVVAILAQLQEDGVKVSALNIKDATGKKIAVIVLPGKVWNETYSDLTDS